jgi:hypothetical protein
MFVANAVLAHIAGLAKAAAPAPLYTCDGKGGEYEFLGSSTGAGTCRGTPVLVVYRDTKTGQLYHRELPDFGARMSPLAKP